jgi:hypothetical protein
LIHNRVCYTSNPPDLRWSSFTLLISNRSEARHGFLAYVSLDPLVSSNLLASQDWQGLVEILDHHTGLFMGMFLLYDEFDSFPCPSGAWTGWISYRVACIATVPSSVIMPRRDLDADFRGLGLPSLSYRAVFRSDYIIPCCSWSSRVAMGEL